VEVRIAAAGIRLLDEIAGPLQECHRRQLGHLPAGKLRALGQLLRDARRPHESAQGHWS
jgi:hypothetical protein